MTTKPRTYELRPTGLTDAEAREIRLLFRSNMFTQRQLAERYRVSKSAIHYVLTNRSHPDKPVEEN